MHLQLAVLPHWLLFMNTVTAIFLGLAALAPVLIASGWRTEGTALFQSYHFACHQLPYRSFFIMGEQVAVCQRDVAIYAAILAGGLVYARLRGRLRPLRMRHYVLFLLPMALDGGTQLPGWRESTWELRLLTGAIFGLGTVWLLYPYIEETVRMFVRDAWDWLLRDREAERLHIKEQG